MIFGDSSDLLAQRDNQKVRGLCSEIREKYASSQTLIVGLLTVCQAAQLDGLPLAHLLKSLDIRLSARRSQIDRHPISLP